MATDTKTTEQRLAEELAKRRVPIVQEYEDVRFDPSTSVEAALYDALLAYCEKAERLEGALRCEVHGSVSRMCELGTAGCFVKHRDLVQTVLSLSPAEKGRVCGE